MSATVVKTYKGERAAERGIAEMALRGYVVDAASTRKVVWSPATGLFTRKQKHTVVFTKAAPIDARTGETRGHGPTCVCADCCAERLTKKRAR